MRLSEWMRREWFALILIVVATTLQLFLVLKPLEFLVANIIPDDAFYYFKIAHNVAAGLGSTFDGINATNGYHPLWLLILISVFKYFSGDVAQIQAALVLSVAFNAATALIVVRILARFSENKAIQACGLFIWLFNPFLLYETINGLETSLSLLLFALFFLLALRFEEGKHSNLVLIGVVGGLMILARLDLALYVIAFLGWLLARYGWNDGFRKVFVVGIMAFIVVAPWFSWNLVNFGTPATSSSIASTLVNHQLIVQDHGDSLYETLKAVMYNSQYELDKLFERTGMYAIACAIFGAAVALAALARLEIPRRLREITAAQSLFVGFLLLFFANAGIRWTVRSWYFVSFDLFLAIFAVTVLAELSKHIAWKRAFISTFLAIVAFSFAVDWSKNQRHGMPQQTDMYQASLWMNQNLPPGSVVGIFNAGIQGYFSKHTVINLDGLVNNAALDALERGDLWVYIRASKIEYIADFPQYVTYRYKSHLPSDVMSRLQLIHRIGEGEGALSIWRVK